MRLWRYRLRLKRMELLDMSVGLSGELLIQQEVLLPEKFNLSLRLSLLLLNGLKSGITSTDKTSYARMLRDCACRGGPHRRINLPVRIGPSTKLAKRVHGTERGKREGQKSSN